MPQEETSKNEESMTASKDEDSIAASLTPQEAISRAMRVRLDRFHQKDKPPQKDKP